MAGLFFCLASAEGAGLLFCPAAIQPHTSVYSAFCAVNAVYTAHTTKQRTGLYSGVSCYLPHPTAADTRPTQADIIPPAPRWSASRTRTPCTDTRYHRHARTLYRSTQPPIIIMYIRVQRCAAVMDPCQTMQQIADHASPAGSAPAACGSLASADSVSAVQTRRTC